MPSGLAPIIIPLSARSGPSCKTWHSQLYTLAGDVQGTQAPQTVEWGTNQLHIYTSITKVLKLTEQLTLLGGSNVPTLLEAVADMVDMALYDELTT